jgi:hypothetical protein
MHTVQLTRCGRAGCCVGMIVKDAGVLSVVEAFNRQMVDAARRQCPMNNCGYVLRMTVRPATDTEIVDYERDLAE